MQYKYNFENTFEFGTSGTFHYTNKINKEFTFAHLAI